MRVICAIDDSFNERERDGDRVEQIEPEMAGVSVHALHVLQVQPAPCSHTREFGIYMV